MNTAKQLFHCFSCGAGRTVLDLVAALEHCGVREPAEKIAVRCSVTGSRGGQTFVPPRETTVTKKEKHFHPFLFDCAAWIHGIRI